MTLFCSVIDDAATVAMRRSSSPSETESTIEPSGVPGVGAGGESECGERADAPDLAQGWIGVQAIENDEISLRVEIAVAVVHVDQAVSCGGSGRQGGRLNRSAGKCENANRRSRGVRNTKSST